MTLRRKVRESVAEPSPPCAFPKPKDRQPNTQPPTVLDFGTLQFQKITHATDRDYLAWIHSHDCAVKRFGLPISPRAKKCGGDVQAAHIAKAGRGQKASDFATIPLCQVHHEQQEPSWPDFEVIYSLSRYFVAFWMLERWHRMTAK